MATSAAIPDGYSSAFTNKAASLSASNYMGLYTLTRYDTLGCASKCDQADGCQAFNMYIERDPSVDPNAINCPNPPSTTNYKCTLWGAPVVGEEATNTGQNRDSFQVVVTGSNGTSIFRQSDRTDQRLTLHVQDTTRMLHHLLSAVTTDPQSWAVPSMLPSTPRGGIHTWVTNTFRSAKARAMTHKRARMLAMYKRRTTVDIQH